MIAAATAVAAAPATTTFSAAAQSVNLTATVSSGVSVVNEGTVTFTVTQNGAVVGNPVTANVTLGSATASYALPAGTVGGAYSIEADYNGTANFGASTDLTQTPTVNPAATATAATPQSVPFSLGTQAVNLAATVPSPAGVVGQGTERFTLLSGAAVVGTPVTANVTAGAALAVYALPGGTPAGTYTVKAEYGGTGSFSASLDATRTVTVTPVGTSTAAAAAATFAVGRQSVGLSATVTSSVGVVAAGTVTFTVRNGATPVGSPVAAAVVNGAAATTAAPVSAVFRVGGQSVQRWTPRKS